MALLLIIQDFIHNKEERAQSTMGLVKIDAALFTNPMESKDTLNNSTITFTKHRSIQAKRTAAVPGPTAQSIGGANGGQGS